MTCFGENTWYCYRSFNGDVNRDQGTMSKEQRGTAEIPILKLALKKRTHWKKSADILT